jgi:drug/metabolite transporter (DMT)-like permease
MNRKINLEASGNSAPTVGALLMLAAALLFAVLDGLIKLLGPPFRVWDIAFYRFACGLAILIPVLAWKGNPFSGQNRKLLVVRGITGCCAFLALVAAIRLIPISTALVLFFSFPAFAAFFSPLIFKEAITRDEIVFVIAALGGVAILFDFTLHSALLGQALAVLGGGFAGLTVSIIKKLRETNGPVVIYLYFCLLGSIISLPPLWPVRRSPGFQWNGSCWGVLPSRPWPPNC